MFITCWQFFDRGDLQGVACVFACPAWPTVVFDSPIRVRFRFVREMPSNASAHWPDRCQVAGALSEPSLGCSNDSRSSSNIHSQRGVLYDDKTCQLTRPSQLNLSRARVSTTALGAAGAFRPGNMAVGQDDTDTRQPQKGQPQQYRVSRRTIGETPSQGINTTCSTSGNISTSVRRMKPAIPCSSSSSSASSSSSDDTQSIEEGSHHEESGFVSAASSVCLDVDTPDSGHSFVRQPPNHRPKPSALSLPGCDALPLDNTLVTASFAKPAEVEVVVLADYRPCCDMELKVVQGQYATALFQTGPWLYVRVASRASQPAQEGFVPTEHCNLALLSPGTLDELSNDFDLLGDPFSPPKQLTVFNSLTTSSPLAKASTAITDSTEPVRYDVATIHRRSSSTRNSTNDPTATQAAKSTSSRSAQNSTHFASHRRHSCSAVQSDTEGYTARRSRSIVAELNVPTRKVPGVTRRTSAESRSRSSTFATTKSTAAQSDCESWANSSPLAKSKSATQQFSKYESDCESVVGRSHRRGHTLSEVPQSRSSRSRLMERFRNFRSKASTLKHTSLEEPQQHTLPYVGRVPSELPNAFGKSQCILIISSMKIFVLSVTCRRLLTWRSLFIIQKNYWQLLAA